ncbi:MAG TPA: pirin family protein, partial [Acidimicrobiales bacterium]|nr:pirin family protein [Acidimicrobiales bacterium]
MSTGDVETEVTSAGARRATGPLEAELTAARQTRLGDLGVERFLPLRHRRTVGGWCFVDHYGPTSVDGGPGMRVPPHPHLGLQTVTWLFQGEV